MVMVTSSSSTLVAGNHCHDFLFRNTHLLAHSLGGAISFISNILDPFSPLPSQYISKIGPDFPFPLPHSPILSPSPSTLFHAHFSNNTDDTDRLLKLIHHGDPITVTDLPTSKHPFGIAAGVAGEIGPDTLAQMIHQCNIVFADAQALIRRFDEDGVVGLVRLRDTGFWEMRKRIGYLKASKVEAEYLEVEEVRKECCVVVTDGENGCTVYWKDGEVSVPAVTGVEVDPTGAGDSFLAGFVVGIVRGFSVYDAAVLGNFFGSITVGQIGVPKFDQEMMKIVRRELDRLTTKHDGLYTRSITNGFRISDKHEGFHAFLSEAAKLAKLQEPCEREDE